jgi:hypothetical protein
MSHPPDRILRARLLEIGCDLDTIPPLVRLVDAYTDPKRDKRGWLPVTKDGLDGLIARGLIKTVPLGPRNRCIQRHVIARILLEGLPGNPRARPRAARLRETAATTTAA